jgi:uncharacterized protein (TIGR03118 family)
MHVRSIKWLLLAGLVAASLLPALASADEHDTSRVRTFHQTNLVSDLASEGAVVTDHCLVNPWGIAYTNSGSPFWTSDNNAGVATLYPVAGQTGVGVNSRIVAIPPTPSPSTCRSGSLASTLGTPTGVVFNSSPSKTDFVVKKGTTSASAVFIFATEDGTIAGWNPTVDANAAIIAVDNSNNPTPGNGAVYKGLTLAGNGAGFFLYASNFRAGTVDVFGGDFKPAPSFAGKFQDPAIPAGFAPFGIQALQPKSGGPLDIFVTYAKQNAEKHDDVAGRGNGFVDVFDTSGNLLRRFASRGSLNSPWGLVVAPAAFGEFSGDVLVGNFGDGRINAFDTDRNLSGDFKGQLQAEEMHGRVRVDDRDALSIDGLWGLRTGNGGNSGDVNTVYFTAGIQGETHGLFGALSPVAERDQDDQGGHAGRGDPGR